MVRSSTRTPTNSHSPPMKSCSSNTPFSCAPISIYFSQCFLSLGCHSCSFHIENICLDFKVHFRCCCFFVALRVSPPEVPRVLCTCMSHATPSLFFYTSDSQAGLTSLRQESLLSDLCLGPQQNACHKPLYHPIENFSVL